MNSGFFDTHLPPDVLRAMRFETAWAIDLLRPYGFEPDDLRQELLLCWLQKSGVYNPARSSPGTFASRIFRNHTLNLLAAARAFKRGAGIQPISLAEAVAGDRDPVSQHGSNTRVGRSGRSVDEPTLTRLEVEEVVDVLPSDLVEVARLLFAGEQPVAVRRRLRITRGKFRRRMERLRVVFRAAGFYNHGIEREAA